MYIYIYVCIYMIHIYICIYTYTLSDIYRFAPSMPRFARYGRAQQEPEGAALVGPKGRGPAKVQGQNVAPAPIPLGQESRSSHLYARPLWHLNPEEPGIDQAWPGPFEGKSSCSTWVQQLPVAAHSALSGQGARPHLLHLRQVPAHQRWLGADSFRFFFQMPLLFLGLVQS